MTVSMALAFSFAFAFSASDPTPLVSVMLVDFFVLAFSEETLDLSAYNCLVGVLIINNNRISVGVLSQLLCPHISGKVQY